jgi:hypothetical protein
LTNDFKVLTNKLEHFCRDKYENTNMNKGENRNKMVKKREESDYVNEKQQYEVKNRNKK